jgi:hypothetical protein
LEALRELLTSLPLRRTAANSTDSALLGAS